MLCPICLDQISANSRSAMLRRCGHCFHKECIDTWKKNRGSCPQCRRFFSPNELHDLFPNFEEELPSTQVSDLQKQIQSLKRDLKLSQDSADMLSSEYIARGHRITELEAELKAQKKENDWSINMSLALEFYRSKYEEGMQAKSELAKIKAGKKRGTKRKAEVASTSKDSGILDNSWDSTDDGETEESKMIKLDEEVYRVGRFNLRKRK